MVVFICLSYFKIILLYNYLLIILIEILIEFVFSYIFLIVTLLHIFFKRDFWYSFNFRIKVLP